MTDPLLDAARRQFHQNLRSKLWSLKEGVASNADKSNKRSKAIGKALAEAVGATDDVDRLGGSAAGREFERCVAAFLCGSLKAVGHLHAGKLIAKTGSDISNFEQYAHLSALEEAAKDNAELAAALGSDYTIKPDIVVARLPESDDQINLDNPVVSADTALFTPLRRANNTTELLHASISCKWTIRSDRAQNSRAEALNLLRNRKGRAPHIAVVTAEPLPGRLAAIAIGTGDVDCTYHIALHELQDVIRALPWDDAYDLLGIMIEGKRLRDISDLPIDLVA